MAGITVTRKERTATELRSAAGKTKDARAARRMVAIALVLEGVDRETAARTCGMDRQTLRGEEGQETVRGTVSPTNGQRYNAEGLGGLVPPTADPRPDGDTGGLGRFGSRPGEGRCGALAPRQARHKAPRQARHPLPIELSLRSRLPRTCRRWPMSDHLIGGARTEGRVPAPQPALSIRLGQVPLGPHPILFDEGICQLDACFA